MTNIFFKCVSNKNHLSSIDKEKGIRTIKIRDGTEHEEVLGVKREWTFPWRNTVGGYGSPVYYDIAVLELGTKYLHVILRLCTKNVSPKK